MSADPEIAGLEAVCPGAKRLDEAGYRYVFLPQLKVRVGQDVKVLDALLCISAHSGYPTRLFLQAQLTECPTIKGCPANWTQHMILARNWWSWSWTGVSADLPAVQILLAHLKAFQ